MHPFHGEGNSRSGACRPDASAHTLEHTHTHSRPSSCATPPPFLLHCLGRYCRNANDPHWKMFGRKAAAVTAAVVQARQCRPASAGPPGAWLLALPPRPAAPGRAISSPAVMLAPRDAPTPLGGATPGGLPRGAPVGRAPDDRQWLNYQHRNAACSVV